MWIGISLGGWPSPSSTLPSKSTTSMDSGLTSAREFEPIWMTKASWPGMRVDTWPL